MFSRNRGGGGFPPPNRSIHTLRLSKMAEMTERRALSRLKQKAVFFFLLSSFLVYTNTHTHLYRSVRCVREAAISCYRRRHDNVSIVSTETGLTGYSRRLRPISPIMFSRKLFSGSHPPQRFSGNTSIEGCVCGVVHPRSPLRLLNISSACTHTHNYALDDPLSPPIRTRTLRYWLVVF